MRKKTKIRARKNVSRVFHFAASVSAAEAGNACSRKTLNPRFYSLKSKRKIVPEFFSISDHLNLSFRKSDLICFFISKFTTNFKRDEMF